MNVTRAGTATGNSTAISDRVSNGHHEIFRRVVAALLLTGTSHTALAQSATPGTSIMLDTINVAADAVTERSAMDAVRERFNVLPGGVALVESRGFPETANLTVSRALRDVPA